MRNVKRTIVLPTRDVIADLAPPPRWIEPELCKLVTTIPAGDGWAHEIKFDGFRVHARIAGGRAALLTRNGRERYPHIGKRGGQRLGIMPLYLKKNTFRFVITIVASYVCGTSLENRRC
jgi:hypothetical protein